MTKTILFVCSANKQRSKTAEDYFSSKHPDFQFLSVGTNKKICEREGTNPMTIEILEQSDLIFVMENSHKKRSEKFHKWYIQKRNYYFEHTRCLQILPKRIN